MPIDPILLSLIVCPITKQTLREAPAELLASLNRGIAQGKVKNEGGRTITHPLSAALVREDSLMLYPIDSEIPVLLVEEGIALNEIR